jgi:hypothetical protein
MQSGRIPEGILWPERDCFVSDDDNMKEQPITKI